MHSSAHEPSSYLPADPLRYAGARPGDGRGTFAADPLRIRAHTALWCWEREETPVPWVQRAALERRY